MSTSMKRLSMFFLLVFLLAGCATVKAATSANPPTPIVSLVDNHYSAQPGDSSLSSDIATFVSAEVSKDGSQVQLKIAYRLPTPCHQTRMEVTPPDPTGRVNVKLYSLFEANKPCALMALATPLEATIGLSNLPTGHYTIYVNDAKAAEFDE
jgi:hypothetical protein